MRLLVLGLLMSIVSFAQDKPTEKSATLQENTFTEGMKNFVLEDYNGALKLFEAFLKMDEKSAVGYYMKSRSESALNKNLDAELSAGTSVGLEKSNFYFLQNYAEILKKNHKTDAAQKALKELIKINPDYIEAYFSLLELQSANGESSAALQTLEAAEKQFGASDKITQAKQIILLKENKVEAALKEGDKRVATTPEFLLNQAKILIESKRYKEAVQMLEEGTRENPDFSDGFGMLHEMYTTQGNTLKSKELLNQILETSYFPYSLKANAVGNYLKLISNDKAEMEFLLTKTQTLVSENPNEARSFVYLGDINFRLNNAFEASNAYQKAVYLDKNQFEVWLALLQLDFKLAQFGRLEKDAENATIYFPNQAVLWFYLGLGNLNNNHFEDAGIALEEAARNGNKTPLKESIHAANEFLDSQVKEVSNKDSKEEFVLYFRAKKALALAESEKALSFAATLTERYPMVNAYKILFAESLNSVKRWEDALKTLQFIREEDARESRDYYEVKGDAFSGLGRNMEANAAWEKALKIDPGNPDIKNKIKEI